MENVIQVRNEYRKQQWAQIIRDCQSSGLSNKEYCRQQGISEKSYYYWPRKLRSAAAEGIPQIVEVEPPAVEDKVYIRFRGAELYRLGPMWKRSRQYCVHYNSYDRPEPGT